MNGELRKLIQELGTDRYLPVSYDYEDDKWTACTQSHECFCVKCKDDCIATNWEYATGDTPEEALRNLIKEPIL